MKRLLASILIALSFVILTAPSASADRGCIINVLGIKVCGELVGVPLPEVVTVTVRPDPIRIPGPTVTLPPQPGPTVTVPGEPGATVTVPGPTETVTVKPEPVNPGPTQGPGQPQTTITVSPGGQDKGSRGTVDAQPPQAEPDDDNETRTVTETIVENVGISIVVALVLAALALATLLLGYYFGHRDAERQEKKLLGNVLSRLRD